MSFEKNQSWIMSCILYGTEAIHFSWSLQLKNAICYVKQKETVYFKVFFASEKNIEGDGIGSKREMGGGGGVI
jgi:hypothetical protein